MSMTLTGTVSGVSYNISHANSGRTGDYDVATRTKLTGIDGSNAYVRRLSAGTGVHMISHFTALEWAQFKGLMAGDSETCPNRISLALSAGTIDAYSAQGYIIDYQHEQFALDVHIVTWTFEPALASS